MFKCTQQLASVFITSESPSKFIEFALKRRNTAFIWLTEWARRRGSQQFISAAILEKGFLVDDTLTISIVPMTNDASQKMMSPSPLRRQALSERESSAWALGSTFQIKHTSLCTVQESPPWGSEYGCLSFCFLRMLTTSILLRDWWHEMVSLWRKHIQNCEKQRRHLNLCLILWIRLWGLNTKTYVLCNPV